MFKRIFITWYIKKGTKKSVDRFLRRSFQKETYSLFFPNILSEPPIERSSRNCKCGKKSSKIRFKDFYIQILVFSRFETNQKVTMLKKYKQKLNYVLFTTPIHHRSVMLISYVIQSYKDRANFCFILSWSFWTRGTYKWVKEKQLYYRHKSSTDFSL